MSKSIDVILQQTKVSVRQQSGGTVNVIQGGAEALLSPGRTLFVAQSWPAGVDTTVCFTDPAAALAAAAALTPAPDVNHPAVILFYPGLYSQPVLLVSNVHLLGIASKGCALTGAVSWTPSAGVNASQSGLFERVYIGRLGISGAVSIDTTAKPLGTGTTFDCRGVDISASLTMHGRAASGGQDFFQCWDGIMGGSAWSFDSAIPNFNNGTQLGASTVTIANCAFGAAFSGCQTFSTVNVVNTPSVGAGAGNKFVNVNVDGTSVFGPVPGSKVGVVTVAAGGRADLRNVEYFSNSNLAGAGAIDRSTWRTTFGPTTAGANTVSLSPMYIDANYNVLVTQTSGSATSTMVSGKQAGQFTLTDTFGGNTFDITILKE